MLSEKINALKFKYSAFKLNRGIKKIINHYLKSLKLSIRYMNEIGIPISQGEKMVVAESLLLYDETVAKLNKIVDVYRGYQND